jgi:hypothetical protein
MKYSIILLSILIASCSLNGLGPIDESAMKEIKTQPNDSIFIGTWKLDSMSYAVIKEKYKYKGEQVELTFNDDKTFNLKNAPDFITDGFGEPVKGEFLNTKGTWQTYQKDNHWEMQMVFESGDLYKYSMTTCYNIFEIDSTIVITHFIGDGDSGDRFLYYKN